MLSGRRLAAIAQLWRNRHRGGRTQILILIPRTISIGPLDHFTGSGVESSARLPPAG